MGVACKSERMTEEEADRGLRMRDTSSGGERVSLGQSCRLNEMVTAPPEDTPEFVIAQLLAAAKADGDEEEAFQAFYAYFPPTTDARHARDNYYKRARQHVDKYLQRDPAESGITFKVCEREEMAGGEIRMFIQSLDSTKSNPPIRLKQDDEGQWKVTFFTP